jgi:nucleoside-diphosphate-sugar epimerase
MDESTGDGGAGGLGINVCTLLLQTGYRIRILDLQTKRNLKSIQRIKDSIEVCWGDIT